MTCNHWTDEEMVDFILNGKNEAYIDQSIHECNDCYEQFVNWKSTLPGEHIYTPSEKLKKRVLKSFNNQLKSAETRRKKSFALKGLSLACISFVLFAFTLLNHDSNQNLNTLNNDSIFIMNSDTDIYELEPVSHNAKGYAWVNDRTREFYLFVDGLSPIENMDYQAWVKTYNGLHDAGILQLLDGRGQVYLKSEPMDKVEYIIVSVEPKGGSRTPSEKNSYIIKVNAK